MLRSVSEHALGGFAACCDYPGVSIHPQCVLRTSLNRPGLALLSMANLHLWPTACFQKPELKRGGFTPDANLVGQARSRRKLHGAALESILPRSDLELPLP